MITHQNKWTSGITHRLIPTLLETNNWKITFPKTANPIKAMGSDYLLLWQMPTTWAMPQMARMLPSWVISLTPKRMSQTTFTKSNKVSSKSKANTKTLHTIPPTNTKTQEIITETSKTANKKPSSPTSTQWSPPANLPQSTFLKP